MPDETDALIDRFTRALASATSRRPAADDDDDMDPRSGRVPYDRFASKSRDLKAAREELAELGRQFEAARAAMAQQTEALKAQAAEQVQQIARQHQEDLALVEHGIKDPLGRTAVRQAWESRPATERGKSAADWWASTLAARAAHEADPTTAAPEIPRVLQGYLPAAAPAPAPKANGQSAPPRVDAGARPMDRQTAESRAAAVKPEDGLGALLAALQGG
jgi:hypothetical protein